MRKHRLIHYSEAITINYGGGGVAAWKSRLSAQLSSYSSLIEKLKIMMVVLRDSSILGSHHLGEFITAWADFDPSGT